MTPSEGISLERRRSGRIERGFREGEEGIDRAMRFHRDWGGSIVEERRRVFSW
jgi:hypothetical protein